MADEKRYYWIKLKTDFFDLETIDWLKSQENGCEYIVLYQQLCLMTANRDGEMASRIGEMIVPYDAKKIARDTKTDIDTVIVALELFIKLGLIYLQEDGIFRIPAVAEMVGSECDSAQRMRKHREKQKALQSDGEVTNKVTGKSSQCDKIASQCNEDIRDRDKRLDIEIETEKECSSSSMDDLESITAHLFSIWMQSWSQQDMKKVCALIVTDTGIDKDKLDLLEYAFEQAQRKGQQAQNWNYVNGCLSALEKKGIHTKQELQIQEYYRKTQKGGAR